MCSHKNLVFSFPITNEWFSEFYEVMKGTRDVKETSEEFLRTTSALADLCQSIIPTSLGPHQPGRMGGSRELHGH